MCTKIIVYIIIMGIIALKAKIIFPTLSIILILFISSGISTPAFAGVVGDVPVDCSVDAGLDVIALDISFGQSWARYQTAVQVLQNNGFTIRTVNIETGDIPSCVVKLSIQNDVALGPPGDVVTPYSPTAVNRVVSFVNNGGALFLNTEVNTVPSFVRTIVTAFGLTDNFDLNIGPNGFSQGTNFLVGTPPGLWDGVNVWVVDGWTTYAPSADSVATDGNFPNGNGLMVLLEPGGGCVLAGVDSNWFRDILGGGIVIGDNQQLLLNTYLFLNECISCTNDSQCNDSNACTTDVCDIPTGICSNTPLVCDDNDACNGLESCNTATGCVAGTPLVCDDGQFCTLDSCNTASGCVFAPNPDPLCERVGGEFIGVDNSALLVAGFQANALWLLPAIAAIGIGVVVIRRIR